MVDQISWMSQKSKQGAYYKIDNLVKNIAYPDFIYDDNALNQYYSALKFSTSGTTVQDYVTLLNDLTRFSYWTSYNYTTFKDIKRDDFNGPPGVVNAWYQPELNSITFPAAILQAPFFDPGWPASINFGAMGIIAGHELTHGFDDEGVQWDGTGVLSTWMDANSSVAFKNMASCVIDEYSQFCPLAGITNPETNLPYSPSCINGRQTQGENIADNGGIHSAFRAYRNAMNFNGPDQRLPGNLVGQFTHDQLFFLSFAQIWCQLPDSPNRVYEQILSDPHSPSKYRVWGTLKNYPAFQTAFNCPSGTNYTNPNHCNVWITDIKPVTGIPPTTPLVPDLNIPPAQPINSSSNVSSKYEKYAQYLTNSIDTTRDPCNDFYAYACGKYQQPYVSIFDMMNNNFVTMAQAMQQVNNEDTKPIQQVKTYFNVCRNALDNWDDMIKSGSQVIKHMQGFQNYTGVCFPLFDKNCNANWLNPTQLGRALGSLSGQALTDTFLTPYADTNWKDPQGPHPYALFVDQPTLANPWIYYIDPAWTELQASYQAQIVQLFQNFAYVLNITTLTMNDYNNVAMDIMNLEVILARELSTDEITRRNFARSYNLFTVDTAKKNYSFIDWPTYFKELFVYAQYEVQTYTNQPDFEFIVMETNKTDMLGGLLTSTNNYNINPTTLFNYLNFRLLITHQDILYSPSSMFKASTKKWKHRLHKPVLGRPRYEPVRKQKDSTNDIGNQIQCAEATMNDMQYANARVFIDWIYPIAGTNRSRIRDSVQKIADSIVIGFRSMIDQIYWMSFVSKKGAYDKIDKLVKNVAFPDFITNNTQLQN
uniref:Uncharacterized protein n=1 Tax=Acrobeloides nanus TaxID=290746 RepID=A0A914CUU7_9BILA